MNKLFLLTFLFLSACATVKDRQPPPPPGKSPKVGKHVYGDVKVFVSDLSRPGDEEENGSQPFD